MCTDYRLNPDIAAVLQKGNCAWNIVPERQELWKLLEEPFWAQARKKKCAHV